VWSNVGEYWYPGMVALGEKPMMALTAAPSRDMLVRSLECEDEAAKGSLNAVKGNCDRVPIGVVAE
jgi:hypothetical protein